MPRRSAPLRKGEHARLRRRRALSSSTPRPGGRRDAEKRLESLDAQIVKLRDGFACVQGQSDGIVCEGLLDCGHLYPRSKFPAGKHLLENQFAQCRRHNTLHIRRPEYFINWHIKKVGQEAHDELHERCTGPSPSTAQLWAMVAERTAMLEDMLADWQMMQVA
jgi:hypothetical protein